MANFMFFNELITGYNTKKLSETERKASLGKVKQAESVCNDRLLAIADELSGRIITRKARNLALFEASFVRQVENLQNEVEYLSKCLCILKSAICAYDSVDVATPVAVEAAEQKAEEAAKTAEKASASSAKRTRTRKAATNE